MERKKGKLDTKSGKNLDITRAMLIHMEKIHFNGDFG